MSLENAARDNNYVTTLTGVDMTTGLLPTKVYIDETTHRLLVSAVITSGGSAGTQYADGTARGTATGTLLMVDDGTNIQSALGTTAGVLKVDLSATAANTTAVKVDGSAVTQPVSGSVTADTELPAAASLNDLAANPTTTGVGAYLYAFDNGTGYNRLGLLNSGADGQSGGRGLTVGALLFNGTNYDRTRSAAGATGTAAVGGLTASGASLVAGPVTVGGLAKTSNPTAVTDGQAVNATYDKLGKQVVVGSIRDLKGVAQTTITSSTAETTIVTAVASTFLDLYGLIITNTSATVTKVTIKDATAGTTRAVIEVPATETRGFMLNESAAIPQAVVNNNWTATCGTSVASVEITALYVKNI